MASAPLTMSASPLPLPPLTVGRATAAKGQIQKSCATTSFPSVSNAHVDRTLAELSQMPKREMVGKVALHCSFAGCGKTFAKACKLQDHERSHTEERPFVCEIDGCQKDFKRKDHLQRHQRSHLGKETTEGQDADERSLKLARPFQCTVIMPATSSSPSVPCDRRFLTRQHLVRHVREFHDQSTSCEEDHAKHTDGAKTKKVRARRPATYLCEIDGCSQAFTKRKLLRSHITLAHSDRDRAAQMAEDEEEAKRIARLPFPCTLATCSRRFATNSKRMAHVEQRHSNAGRYVCMHDHTRDGTPGGIAQFSTWSALQAHQRADHKPTCPVARCGKQFKEARNLRQHMQRVHGGANDGETFDGSLEFSAETEYDKVLDEGSAARSSFKCSSRHCSQKFRSRRALRRHAFKYHDTARHFDAADADEADVSENETDVNSDNDDDFFRREGGAVPEASADRGKAHKRVWDGTESDIRTFSLGALTGRSYQDVGSPSAAPSKKRRLRGRVLGCPWHQICRLRDELPAEKHLNGADDGQPACTFRFSRLYDVQRHLRGVHRVNLAQVDIQALLFEEERMLLGPPRSSTKLAQEVEEAEAQQHHHHPSSTDADHDEDKTFVL